MTVYALLFPSQCKVLRNLNLILKKPKSKKRSFSVDWLQKGGDFLYEEVRPCAYAICDYSDTDYAEFWSEHDREYEDAVERIALRRLAVGMAGTCIEIGCGFGRLVNEYAPLCSHVLLTDYAENMIQQAKTQAQRLQLNNVECKRVNLYELETLGRRFDHAVCVRVMHHVENVYAFFRQVNLFLQDGGTFILEYANKRNVLEILRWLFRQPNIEPLDYHPSKRKANIYYNYHPDYVRDMLMEAGFEIEEELTVSLFRSAFLKRIFGWRFLSRVERILQKPLSRFHPGPSVFLRARKVRRCNEISGNEVK